MGSLKVFLVSLLVLAVVLASAMGAAAADINSNGKIVKISRVSAYPSDSDVLLSVNLNADRKLTDAKLTVSVPELGIRAAHRVDFSKKKKQTVRVVMPALDEFDPYVRIVFSSDEGKRVKFRPLIVQ